MSARPFHRVRPVVVVLCPSIPSSSLFSRSVLCPSVPSCPGVAVAVVRTVAVVRPLSVLCPSFTVRPAVHGRPREATAGLLKAMEGPQKSTGGPWRPQK